ncbi:hypothetical protein [Pseudofrankia asymbiotica]|uniref:NHL domain-containing protein n=1 Tax=Pseudofrankia asymbiotica TaxID=1834516 RepID=UPI00105562E5|nr:hypothetical protein [Pseudofrankia asymbiotica]
MAAGTTAFIVGDSEDSSAGPPADAAGTAPTALPVFPSPTGLRPPVSGPSYAGEAVEILDFAPENLAVSRDGTLYVSSNDATGATIYEIGRDGEVVNLDVGYPRYGGRPVIGQVDFAYTGNPDYPELYYPDSHEYRINQIVSSGVATVAGTGAKGFSGDGGPATEAQIGSVEDLAVLADGTIYLADYENERIRKVTPDGVISTVIHVPGGGLSTVEVGPDGAVYFTDLINCTVDRLDAGGGFTIVAGGRCDETADGRMGEGGPASQAGLLQPVLEMGPDGTMYVLSPTRGTVRRIGPDGIITTVAGTGQPGSGGDGGPAVAAPLSWPNAVVVDASGALYIVEITTHRVRRISPDGIITTIAVRAP